MKGLLFLSGLTLKIPVLPERSYIYGQSSFGLREIRSSACLPGWESRGNAPPEAAGRKEQPRGVGGGAQEQRGQRKAVVGGFPFQIQLTFGPPCAAFLAVLGVAPPTMRR